MNDTATPPTSLGRPFLRVWFGQTVSEIGSMVTAVAAAVFVFLETGSAMWLGVLSAVAGAPVIAVAALGPLLDRWPRRTTMIAADVLAAIGPLVLLIPALRGDLEVWHLVVAGAMGGLGTAVQFAVAQAAMRALVEPDALDRANSLNQLGSAAGIVVGPVIATPLLVGGGIEAVLMLDLATFAVAMITLVATPFDDPPAEVPDDDGSWRSAWTWLRTNDAALVTLMAGLGVINLALSWFNVALLATATAVVGAARTGLVLFAGGLAMLLGSAVGAVRGTGAERMRTVAIGLTLTAVGCVVAALRPNGTLLVIGVAVALFMVPQVNAAVATIFNERVPVEMQGRVFALRGAIGQALHPIGSVAAGWAISRLLEPALRGDGTLGGSLGRLIGGGEGRGAAAGVLLAGLALGGLAMWFAFGRLRRAFAEPVEAREPEPVRA